ncbi:MAG: hypothetical protein D6732_27995 [Methanobacteriota archaeon]|nr:MAG: hypothetical protein D6732_27995 [Euryarchaeota archaeon]
MVLDVVIQFPRVEGLNPINTYLHPGLWLIGNEKQNGSIESNNLSVLELITGHLKHHNLTSFKWVGKREILQTYKLAETLSEQKNIRVQVVEAHQDYSVEQLVNLPDKPVLLYPGHILTNANFSRMINFHHSHNGLGTVLVSKGIQYRVGIAKVDPTNLKITAFKEKPYDENRSIYTGIVLLKEGWRSYLNSFLKVDWEPDTETRVLQYHGYRSSIDLFVDYLIKKSRIKAYVMDATEKNKKPWWINLSQLETWRKLDTSIIFNNMKHLF